MKRISFLLAVALISMGINAQKTYALLTGVSNYGFQDWNLQNTTKDVKQLKKVLDKQEMIVATLTSSYATISNIEKKLNAIIQLAKPEDKIIFFFSGHGDTGRMITYGFQGFYYEDLMKILSNAKTKEIFCFIDACKSGSVNPMEYYWADVHKGITFMMSSRADEYSAENNWIGHGLYTQALLKGLRGKADKNNDRQVTLMELFRYVYNDVTARTKNYSVKQHPQLIGPSSSHDTVITRW
ncbi:MAG: caspase family protein [Prevotella sp.]|nr:caspase family protein [Prevotella sp.]